MTGTEPSGDTDRRIFYRTGEELGVSWYKLYLADRLAGRITSGLRNTARWLILHAAVQAGAGHIRTDLGRIAAEMRDWYVSEREPRLPERVEAEASGLLAAALDCSLAVRLAGEDSTADGLPVPRPPLLVTHDGRFLYLLKRRRMEDRFLAAVADRTGRDTVTAGESPLAGRIDRDEGPAGALADGLRSGRRLMVLAGGPGTGKTTTLIRLLKLLGPTGAVVALCAPTGRAAARLAEGLPANLPAVRGTTIHGLLGMVPGGPPRHHPGNPVPADLVVVDEASMVDLSMMTRLLDALPPSCALILSGDPDQLPSVEAGAILGDLIRGADAAAGQGRTGPLDGSIVRLDRVYRSDRGILDAAAAVREGNLERFLEACADRPESDRRVTLHPPLTPLAFTAAVAADCSPTRAVLTPLRRGSWGAAALNDRISQILGGTRAPFHGMPVGVTVNDPSKNLWNGDRGVVVERDGRMRVLLEGAEGGRELPLSSLPGWEAAWVQTIHRSQGSEFDEVTIVVPEAGRGFLTRELLYTAITRARHHVHLYADAGTIGHALERRVRRNSRIEGWASGVT